MQVNRAIDYGFEFAGKGRPNLGQELSGASGVDEVSAGHNGGSDRETTGE